MAHTLIITAYNPDFSGMLKAGIKKSINPSMVNRQDDEKAYFLQTIINENLLRTEEDDILIQELQSQNVEYVEF